MSLLKIKTLHLAFNDIGKEVDVMEKIERKKKRKVLLTFQRLDLYSLVIFT